MHDKEADLQEKCRAFTYANVILGSICLTFVCLLFYRLLTLEPLLSYDTEYVDNSLRYTYTGSLTLPETTQLATLGADIMGALQVNEEAYAEKNPIKYTIYFEHITYLLLGMTVLGVIIINIYHCQSPRLLKYVKSVELFRAKICMASLICAILYISGLSMDVGWVNINHRGLKEELQMEQNQYFYTHFDPCNHGSNRDLIAVPMRSIERHGIASKPQSIEIFDHTYSYKGVCTCDPDNTHVVYTNTGQIAEQ